jgi:hypothetical protein
MSTEFQPAADTAEPSRAATFEEVLERCYVKTAEALSQSGAANDTDIMKALGKVRESQAKSVPADILEILARVMGTDEERLGLEIAKLSASVASTMTPPPPSIPFASRLIAPSAFYESFDTLHDLGKMLLAPVLYAEDTDSIGVGSINPIAAEVFSDEIHKAVHKRFGIRPFLTVVTMEYESWTFLCRKHFELP